MKKLVLLLGLDSCLISLHAGQAFFAFPASNVFDIGRDWSLAEIFQYLKEVFAAFILLRRAVNQNSMFYGAWSLFFFYLFLDDALMVREWLGHQIGSRLRFEPSLGLRANDIGELVALVLPVGALSSLMAVYHTQSDPKTRAFTWQLLPWVVVLVLCGVLADMLHVAVMEDFTLHIIFELIEDGGEMIVMSFLVWKVVQWYSSLKLQPDLNASRHQV